MDNLTPNRGYFSGPEGKVNATTWGALAVAALFIIWVMGGKIGDYIIEATDNIWAFLLKVVLPFVLLTAALLDPKKRIWYVFRGITRWLMSGFIKLDPIGIRKSYVERLKARMKTFNAAVAELRGILQGIIRDAQNNRAELTEHQGLFQAALKEDNKRAEVTNSRELKRCQALEKEYLRSIKDMKRKQDIVVRVQEICADEITDKESEIRSMEKLRKIDKANRGISGAMGAILKGLPEKDMYDEAGVVIYESYDQSIGQFDNVLDMTKDIINGKNLADSAALEEALAKFGKGTTPDSAAEEPLPSLEEESSDAEYRDLLK